MVASGFPQLRAVIDRHDVRVTFDPDEPGILAKAIVGCSAIRNRLSHLRRYAAAPAAQFNWQDKSERLLQIFDRSGGQSA